MDANELNELRTDLPLYLAGDLPPDRLAAIGRALAASAGLREALAALRHAMAAVAAADPAADAPELATWFDERLAPALAVRPPLRLRVGLLAAGLVLAFGLGGLSHALVVAEGPPPSSVRTLSEYARHADVEHGLLRGLLALAPR